MGWAENAAILRKGDRTVLEDTCPRDVYREVDLEDLVPGGTRTDEVLGHLSSFKSLLPQAKRP